MKSHEIPQKIRQSFTELLTLLANSSAKRSVSGFAGCAPEEASTTGDFAQEKGRKTREKRWKLEIFQCFFLMRWMWKPKFLGWSLNVQVLNSSMLLEILSLEKISWNPKSQRLQIEFQLLVSWMHMPVHWRPRIRFITQKAYLVVHLGKQVGFNPN